MRGMRWNGQKENFRLKRGSIYDVLAAWMGELGNKRIACFHSLLAGMDWIQLLGVLPCRAGWRTCGLFLHSTLPKMKEAAN